MARVLVEPPSPRQGLWSPGPPFRVCDKEPGGSPKFPSSPSEAMPRSQTPVVSRAPPTAHPGLLPSRHWKPSATHNATHFGAPSRGLSPRYTRLRTAPYGEARGVATDLLARLSSRTPWPLGCSPPGEQQSISWTCVHSQGFGLTLARPMADSAV